MKRVIGVPRGASRRSFLKNGIVAASATLSASVMGVELSARERVPEDDGPAITEGDTVLQFSS